jgi:RimJ/RimL family protein N-acetyltransferase
VIGTDRLILRPWRPADVRAFHAMGQDPEVMRHLGPLASRADARGAFARMAACQAQFGFCFWAIERRGDARFIGFCGLKPGRGPIAGEIEIGWRLARAHWGEGLAREAAQAVLAWSWANLNVPSVTAITTPGNVRSWGLMERLGMTRFPLEDFDHPELEPGDPLRPHILYRIARPLDA